MSVSLKDALAIARINRIKSRIARGWQERKAQQACPDCGRVHANPIVELFRHLAGNTDEPEAAPSGEPKH